MICLRCWTLTREFNAFYTTIERAQCDFNANASIDEAEEHSSVNATNDACYKQLKANFLQNDTVSLNSLNAGIDEADQSFSELGANYEILNFELLSDDLLQKIISDEAIRLEMEVGDAERTGMCTHFLKRIPSSNFFLKWSQIYGLFDFGSLIRLRKFLEIYTTLNTIYYK